MHSIDLDTRLVLGMAQGDKSALGQLYDRHAPLLLGVALRLLGDRPEAEDLVHDVLIEAWQRADTYDPARASVRSWLLLRLRSRALDRLRSARISRRAGVSDEVSPGGRPRWWRIPPSPPIAAAWASRSVSCPTPSTRWSSSSTSRASAPERRPIGSACPWAP
ncbi:MAG: sigma-70 family RNA polymerase sigma factor [bacterium]